MTASDAANAARRPDAQTHLLRFGWVGARAHPDELAPSPDA
jgi:hypothetical protein